MPPPILAREEYALMEFVEVRLGFQNSCAQTGEPLSEGVARNEDEGRAGLIFASEEAAREYFGIEPEIAESDGEADSEADTSADSDTPEETAESDAQGAEDEVEVTELDRMTKAELFERANAEGIDLDEIEGSGVNGNVLVDDLIAAIEAAEAE